MASVKASIYCTGCGTQNIVAAPMEGMEVVCSNCSKSIILKKKAGSANSRRMRVASASIDNSNPSLKRNTVNSDLNRETSNNPLRSHATSNGLKRESVKLDPAAMQGTLLGANLKLMERIESLEDKVLEYQTKNGKLNSKITKLSVSHKEQAAADAGDFPGKGLIEATLLEVKDQKAGQDLYHAMQKKESETLYKTINAVMLEIYEIKKEIEQINKATSK
ncbi:MAG: hypothetical protein COA79_06580 [Planctomycetota bacterium]|nr:MAG: hypothetical protein COA79_06580 [Planctomycetota bacterium]